MTEILDAINSAVSFVNSYLWILLMFLLVGTGVFFTIRTNFIQVRHFKRACKRVFGSFSLTGKASNDGMSSFQALATAIAAQVGTGSIAGCATALILGGPGAILWMWIAAFFGMATIYGEACLAQATKEIDKNGEIIGGPVYYILKAFKGGFGKFMAGFFAVAITLALGVMGCVVQSNSISDAFNSAFGVPVWSVGIVIAIFSAFIFVGGVSRIASVTEKLVPIMAGLYLLGGIFLLIVNFKNVPGAFASIFACALNPSAIPGAGAGIAVFTIVRIGISKGLFSNEAGMGSTPHAHAVAKVNKPQEQGEVAMMGVFITSFIVFTMTAIVLLSSGILGNEIQYGETGSVGPRLAQMAFSTGFGDFLGPKFVAICLLFFAFSTIIGWYFFARQNVRYLFGNKAVMPFTWIAVICIFAGTMLKVDMVWNLVDFFNGFMVFPNLIALLALSGVVGKMAKGEDVKL